MKTIRNWRQGCVMLAFYAYSFSAIAANLNPSDTTAQEQLRQQERLNQLRQQQEIKPDIRDAVDQLKHMTPVATDLIPENETPCFSITKIVLIGDSAHQFQFALDEVLAKAYQAQTQSKTPHSAILGSCLCQKIGVGDLANPVIQSILGAKKH